MYRYICTHRERQKAHFGTFGGMCMYMYICIYIERCICIDIYAHIERETESTFRHLRGLYMYRYICINVAKCMYRYTCIYIERDRKHVSAPSGACVCSPGVYV